MPFTPFHLGPGLAVKAIAGRHFSFLVFGFSQVAIDVEPLVHILRGDPVLHGFTHTYLGATLIGAASVLVGRPVCQFLLRRWHPGEQYPFQVWLRGTGEISWVAAIIGAFVGTYSHVFLDSLMHRDLRPLAPFSPANGMLYAISVGWLHVLCVASGIFGIVAMYCIYYHQQRGSAPQAE